MPSYKSILRKACRYKSKSPCKRFETALSTYANVKTLHDDIETKIKEADVLNVVLDVTGKIKTAKEKSERFQLITRRNNVNSYPILDCSCLSKMFHESRQKLEDVCTFLDTVKLKLEIYCKGLNDDVCCSNWNYSESINEMEEYMSHIVTLAQNIWQSNVVLENINKKLTL